LGFWSPQWQINYYGNFYRTRLRPTLKRIDLYIIRWARRKKHPPYAPEFRRQMFELVRAGRTEIPVKSRHQYRSVRR
jgi:RNA-directed DNA polymerase